MIPWVMQTFGIASRGLVTILVMLGCAILLIAWDIIVVVRDKPTEHDTISEIIARQGRLHPIIPFAFGVLMGHFFWTQFFCTPGCAP